MESIFGLYPVMTNTGGGAKTTCSVTDFTADRAKVPCSALAQLCNLSHWDVIGSNVGVFNIYAF